MKIILHNNLTLQELVQYEYLFFGINYIILVNKDDVFIKPMDVKKIIISGEQSNILNNNTFTDNIVYGIELSKNNISLLINNKFFLYNFSIDTYKLDIEIFSKHKSEISRYNFSDQIGVNSLKGKINEESFNYLKNIY